MEKNKEHNRRDYKRIERTLPKASKVQNIRSENILIRVSRLEKDIITDNAKPFSLSEYLRQTGQKNTIKPVLGREFFELLTQIKYVGNNINQITKHINANKYLLKDYNKSDKLIELLENNLLIMQEVKEIFFAVK